MKRQRAFAAITLTLALIATSCSDDGNDSPAPTEPTSADSTTDDTTTVDTTDTADSTVGSADVASINVVAGSAFPEARCEANQAAGTITYLTGFDFAAAASILEVVVADERGYFDELCLDVELRAGGSTQNLPLIATNEAQFSSAGSFTELAIFAEQNDTDLVALSVDGHVAIDVLMAKPDQIDSLAAIAGQNVGVKFALPPAIAVMLQQEADLVETQDYSTVLLDGFDPVAHMAIENVVAVPGWRSNEPGALERAGVPFDLYDPSEFGIPGSFGLIYTNQTFLDAHPTAAEDFMRAAMRALAESIADPAVAAQIAVDRINGNGNPMFLSPEGEAFRWETDAATITASTPDGVPVGVPVGDELESQIAAYEAVGFFGDSGAPTVDGRYNADVVAGLYADDGSVIWPG